MLGPDHPDALNSRNSLAAAYLAAGRAADAIPLFEQTLASRERLLGPDDPDILPRGITSLLPTRTSAGPSMRSRCSSGPWPYESDCWAPIIPAP